MKNMREDLMAKKQVIRVFSRPNCGPCMAIKRFLTGNFIPYEEATEQEAADRGYRSVPVTEIWEDEYTMIKSFPGLDMKNLTKLKEDYFGTV